LIQEIAERPVLRGNNAFDLANDACAFPCVFLAAEPMNFEAAKVRHHVLKAEVRQPAELQQFGE